MEDLMKNIFFALLLSMVTFSVTPMEVATDTKTKLFLIEYELALIIRAYLRHPKAKTHYKNLSDEELVAKINESIKEMHQCVEDNKISQEEFAEITKDVQYELSLQRTDTPKDCTIV